MANHDVTIIKGARDIFALDARLRSVLGSDISGISTWGNEQIKVHFLVPPGAGDTTAQNIVAGHNILTVATSKTSIIANGIDKALVTCSQLPTNLDYVIWRNGAIALSGSIADGTLGLTAIESGTYLAEIKEQGSYRTGYITVEAV